MDLIKQLLDSGGYTAILVIVDWLTKQSIFIPTYNTLTAWNLQSSSSSTSSPSTEFQCTSRWTSKALDMHLHFTSSYHPEGNRQMEQVNQTLEQYLHIYYQQDNWVKLLLLVEFTYNNTPNATTGLSLFFANKGYYIRITVLIGIKNVETPHTRHPKCVSSTHFSSFTKHW